MPDRQPQPTIGGMFGQALGQGLLGYMNQYTRQSAIDRALGMYNKAQTPQEQTYAIANLPIEEQQTLMPLLVNQQKMQQLQQKAQREQQESSILDNVLGNLLQEEAGINDKGILPGDEISAGVSLKDIQNLSPEAKKFAIQQLQQKRKEEREESKTARQETKEFRKKVLDDFKDYKSTTMRLDRMKLLNKEGDLDTPVFAAMMNKLGIPAFLSADSQEFDKLSKDLLKNIRTFFGARINQVEVENFLKTIPTLTQSPEGRDRVIANLQKLIEGQKVYYEAYKDVMKGRKSPPSDLEERVMEKADEKLNALAEDFILGFNKPGQTEQAAQVPGAEKRAAKNGKDSSKANELGTVRALRGATRSGSRAAETIAGLPGDVASAVGSLVSEPDREKVGIAKGFTGIKEAGKSAIKDAVGAFRKIFPTSGELKDFSEKISGGFTKSRSKAEEISDEMVSDIAALGTGGMNIAKGIGVSVASQLGKGVTSLFTKSEGKQEAAKIGTMFLASVINPKRTANFVKTLYQDAKSLVPEGASVVSKPLKSELSSIEKSLAKGGIQPSSNVPASKAISEMKNVLKKETVPVEDLLQAKVNINEELGKIWQSADLDKVGKRAARRKLLEVQNSIQKSIEIYGKENPEFFAKYKAADSAFAAEKSSRKAMDFIKKSAKNLKIGALLGGTEAGLIYAGHGAAAPISTAIGIGAIKTGEPIVRFMKDPTWRKYYIQVMKSALNENKIATAKNLAKLNNQTEKLNNKKGK